MQGVDDLRNGRFTKYESREQLVEDIRRREQSVASASREVCPDTDGPAVMAATFSQTLRRGNSTIYGTSFQRTLAAMKPIDRLNAYWTTSTCLVEYPHLDEPAQNSCRTFGVI